MFRDTLLEPSDSDAPSPTTAILRTISAPLIGATRTANFIAINNSRAYTPQQLSPGQNPQIYGGFVKLVRHPLLIALLLVLGASSAHAAVAQLTCSSPTLTDNVSYFDVGITDAISGGSSGAVPAKSSTIRSTFTLGWSTFSNSSRS
jgi:hypothetical protein